MVNINAIYCGDCLKILQGFPSESVDLIYLDPPFFSNKHYEVIWGNHAEKRSFGDRWEGGIMHYINWMRDRLEQCHRVLKKTGSIYLHCDYHASHQLKVMMDKVFGENNFINEIIWHYRKWTAGEKLFQRNHDVILFYSKSKNYVFNTQYQPLSAETIKRWKGKKQVATFEDSGKRNPGQSLKEDSKGVPMADVWVDINIIAPSAKERLGYPTQKPEGLLDRIIKVSSNEGDLVLDPFVGGGTTIAVAQKLNRNWIGIDVSPTACKVAEKRLKNLGIKDIAILGLPTSIKELESLPHFEFQNWVCKQLNGRSSDKKSGDMGIDGNTSNGIPIQVKQSQGIGRNVIDNFETAIRRADKEKGIIVGFSFVKGAIEEVARIKDSEGVIIKLLTISEMLKADFNPNELF